METVQSLVKFDYSEKTLNLIMGIGEERSREILDWLDENTGKRKAAEDIEATLKQFHEVNECAFALYSIVPVNREFISSEKKDDIPSLESGI